MAHLEFWLFSGAFCGLALGVLAVFWVRGRGPAGGFGGRLLFIGTLLALGGASLVAAFHRADGLVPLGLSSGFLVVAMLIESPHPADGEASALASAEEL